MLGTKGRFSCEISTPDELVLTDMVFDGVFNDLSTEQAVALLSCFVHKEGGGKGDAPPVRQEMQVKRRRRRRMMMMMKYITMIMRCYFSLLISTPSHIFTPICIAGSLASATDHRKERGESIHRRQTALRRGGIRQELQPRLGRRRLCLGRRFEICGSVQVDGCVRRVHHSVDPTAGGAVTSIGLGSYGHRQCGIEKVV